MITVGRYAVCPARAEVPVSLERAVTAQPAVPPQRRAGAPPIGGTYLAQSPPYPDPLMAAQLARIEDHLRVVRQWCLWIGVCVPLLIVGLMIIFDAWVLSTFSDLFDP